MIEAIFSEYGLYSVIDWPMNKILSHEIFVYYLNSDWTPDFISYIEIYWA